MCILYCFSFELVQEKGCFTSTCTVRLADMNAHVPANFHAACFRPEWVNTKTSNEPLFVVWEHFSFLVLRLVRSELCSFVYSYRSCCCHCCCCVGSFSNTWRSFFWLLSVYGVWCKPPCHRWWHNSFSAHIPTPRQVRRTSLQISNKHIQHTHTHTTTETTATRKHTNAKQFCQRNIYPLKSLGLFKASRPTNDTRAPGQNYTQPAYITAKCQIKEQTCPLPLVYVYCMLQQFNASVR